MLTIKDFKTEISKVLNDRGITHDSKNQLINKSIQNINAKLRVYYNFSIADFQQLLEGITTYEEYQKVIGSLNPRKQYSFHTKEDYADFIEYLTEQKDNNTIKIMEDAKVKINDNLYQFSTSNLNQKYWN